MSIVQLRTLCSGGGGNVYSATLSSGPPNPAGAAMFIESAAKGRLIARIMKQGPTVLKVALNSDAATRREADMLRRLSHDHVLPLLALVEETFEYQGRDVPVVGMLLPKADGTMDAWRVATPVPERRRALVPLLHSLMSGLAHIHGLGWLHGDLHILNILSLAGRWVICDLDAHRAGSLVRCLDLGTPFWSRAPEVTRCIARAERVATDPESASAQLRAQVQFAEAAVARAEADGTPMALRDALYTSPSRAVDLWAVGMVAYFVATDCHWLGPPPSVTSQGWSTHPLDGELTEIALASRASDDRLADVGRLCGSTAQQVMRRCLSVDPRLRTTSASILELIQRDSQHAHRPEPPRLKRARDAGSARRYPKRLCTKF
jgi:serine/threonine protein kinase